jgi:hypothetical protein
MTESRIAEREHPVSIRTAMRDQSAHRFDALRVDGGSRQEVHSTGNATHGYVLSPSIAFGALRLEGPEALEWLTRPT